VHVGAIDGGGHGSEEFERRHVVVGTGVEDGSGPGALEGQGAQRRAGILDAHLEVALLAVKPVQTRFGCGDSEVVVIESGHCAVVEDFTVVVAPAQVGHATHAQLADILDHDP
jgi:hypothetical protein